MSVGETLKREREIRQVSLEEVSLGDWIGVSGSPEGARYRDEHPDVWAQLRENYSEFELMTRLVGVVGRPVSPNPGC